MADDHLEIARRGEDRAAEWLQEHGWEVVERNWVRELGELDIIARREVDWPDGAASLIAFVEVKTREHSHGPLPEVRVGAGKRRKLAGLGRLWLTQAGRSRTLARFDIVGVDLDTGAIRHYPSAFDGRGMLR